MLCYFIHEPTVPKNLLIMQSVFITIINILQSSNVIFRLQRIYACKQDVIEGGIETKQEIDFSVINS